MKKFKKLVAPALAILLLCGGFIETSFATGETKHVTVAQPKTNIIGDISIIREVNSKSELSEVMVGDRIPSTMIFHIEDSFASVEDIIDTLDYKVIPAFCIADKTNVNALADTLNGLKFYDVCIVSKDASIVKYAKELLPAVRGVVDYTEQYKNVEQLSNKQLIEIRKEVMENDAYIAMLPAELCNREAVQHLYDGRIPVWAKLSEDATVKEQYSAVTSGALGVISDASDTLMEIACEKLEPDTLTRTSLNVGHKGMPSAALENTIEGGQAAVKAGADALEIDVYMTKDNKVVIMHDYKTGGTCDKDMVIAESTLAQLKELWVVQNEDGTGTDFKPCRIPTLEEFFKEFKDDEIRFFIEFKGGGEEIVKAVRDLVNQYDMYDRCTTIAFDASVMVDIRELWPEMPISYLTYTMPIDENNADASFASVMNEIGKYNATYSPSISTQGGIEGPRASLVRGILTNGWTYEKQSTYLVSYMNGESSITGDDASAVAKYPTSIVAKNLIDGIRIDKGQSVVLDVVEHLYHGKNQIDSGLDCLVIEGDGVVIMNGNQLTFNKSGEITFMLEYQHPITSINVPTLYSEPITVTVVGTQEESNEVPGQSGTGENGTGESTDGAQKDKKDDIGTGDMMFKMIPVFAGLAIVSLSVVILIQYKKKRM